MTREHLQFVTGKLAEHAMRRVLAELAPKIGFDYAIDVLPITVAALMTPVWVARHLRPNPAATKIILPGYCEGDLSVIEAVVNLPVVRGPRDLRQLPQFFGQQPPPPDQLQYNIEILAEINHAPRLSLDQIIAEAIRLAADGADVIDVGCDPGNTWAGVADCVRALRDRGLRVSIDSLNSAEIGPAVKAGAELVLSVNASNRDAARDWGCEVVVIPDDFATLGGLDETIELLANFGIKLRIDPVLEPIGCGFAASLGRYLEVRRRYPDAEMMMGIGNLTELSDADSAPINLLLLGICEELRIASVLTTQVINWARTSVRECDLARRMVCFAIQHGVPPKHVNENLVLLRDAKLFEYGKEELDRLASQIKDHNFRLFAEGGNLHLVSAGMHLQGTDPFLLFEQLLSHNPRNVDPSHAFYLGFELCKAATALLLGKRYEQDEALNWGFLTQEERHHRLKRAARGESPLQNDQSPMTNDQDGK
jgi:dihydropteroate synthase-like protein